MKQYRSLAVLIVLVLALAAPAISHAMSTFVELSMEPEWPATTDPGTTVVYKITAVSREGQGLLEVVLSSGGMPAGAIVTFSPSVLRFTGRVPETQTATMTVTCAQVTPVDNYPFTVTGTARRESITITNQVGAVPDRAMAPRPVLYLERLLTGDNWIRGTGASGETYRVESTTDLANPVWTPDGSTTADGNGRFTFIAVDTNDSSRFFRAVASSPAAPPQN